MKRRYPRTITHLAVVSRFVARRWMLRAMFVIGGLAVGAAAVLMAMAADRAQLGFGLIVARWHFAPLLLTPAGFALCAVLARGVFPNSAGSGIPQVIAALRLRGNPARARLVSPWVGVGKVVVMTLGLACGGSIGREGPTVQVGAAIMHAIGRISPYRQPGFLLAGAAAGVAAAFNTPLAGIVFGIEELGRSFEARTSGLIIGAVIAAGLTALAVQGDYSYFGSTPARLPFGRGWLAMVICAAICGLAGGLFIRLLVAVARGLPGAVGRAVGRHPILFAAGCGLVVALCGAVSDGAVFGTGYAQARAILDGGPMNPWFGPLKFIATVASSISGIPGGVFSPSLAVGAGLAGTLAPFLPAAPQGALVLIGMAAFLTGVVQAPITAFVIVLEMTNDHAMVIPLMATALIANAASKLLSREGLYLVLSENYVTQVLGASQPAR